MTSQYLYPPIKKFEIVSQGGKYVIKNGDAFREYFREPYIYQYHQNNDVLYLCVWEYDKKNKRLIGRDGQSQPYDLISSICWPSPDQSCDSLPALVAPPYP